MGHRENRDEARASLTTSRTALGTGIGLVTGAVFIGGLGGVMAGIAGVGLLGCSLVKRMDAKDALSKYRQSDDETPPPSKPQL